MSCAALDAAGCSIDVEEGRDGCVFAHGGMMFVWCVVEFEICNPFLKFVFGIYAKFEGCALLATDWLLVKREKNILIHFLLFSSCQEKVINERRLVLM